MQPLFGEVVPGWDLVLIARRSLLQAPYPELQAAVSSLLKKAGLLSVEDERP
jgi:RNase P protein component